MDVLKVICFVLLCSLAAVPMSAQGKSEGSNSTYLPPKSISFRAFDNNVDGTETDFYLLTTTRPIFRGTTFSLTRVETIKNGIWKPQNGKLSSVEFEYLGIDPIPTSTNLCVYVGPDGVVDVWDISINGHINSSSFSTINNSGGNINVSTTTGSYIAITQGDFVDENNGMVLKGGVVDILSLGISENDFESSEIGESFTSPGDGITSAPGSYYGVLQCDGLIYICEYLDLQPFIENWVIEQGGDLRDKQALCDELCDLLCEDCNFSFEIGIEECTVKTLSEIECEPPFNYKWQKKVNEEWITLFVASSNDGTIEDYSPIYNSIEYRLQIDCNEDCTKESNVVSPTECIAPCEVILVPNQSSCYLNIGVQNCDNYSIEWYFLDNGVYTLIPNATTDTYKANSKGVYQVRVIGCTGCTDLIWDFYVSSFNIKASQGEIEVCNYLVCFPYSFVSVVNIVAEDSISLNEEDGFSFNYTNSFVSLNAMADDINSWLDANGYIGTASIRNCGKNQFGLYITNTNALFNLIVFLTEESDGDSSGLVENTVSFTEYGCHFIDGAYTLVAQNYCDNPSSILWSTGETGAEITVTHSGVYSVTIVCEDGCEFTESYTIYGGVEGLFKKENPNAEQLVEKGKINTSNNSEIELYPNPSTGYYKMKIDTKTKLSECTVNLYATDGRLLKNIYKGSKESGTIEFSFNLSEFNSGLYFIKVEEMQNFNTKKLILIK